MRKFLERLLLLFLGPILLLGIVETTLRVADIGYPTSFLIPRDIGGRHVYVDNQFFGYRFFPQRMTRTSAPIVITKKKEPGVIRVFVLGESAAMGEPQSNFGLSRFLECLLADRIPGKRFEVINAAMTAINSHVIVEIARDCAAFEPDYFVLYMGNNEVVGPYGPGTVFGNSTHLTPLRVRATRLRLTQGLRLNRPGKRWAGMEMFRDKEVEADDDRLDAVYENFLGNLNRIISSANRAGASVVLSTVAVNLRDCAPFAGVKARQAFEAGDFAGARDLDQLRFRADSIINETIRNVGKWSPIPVRFVDAEALFGVAGKDYFVDHVHFNAAGNYKLACAVADQIAPVPSRAGGPPPEHVPALSDCLDRMMYTPWNELDLVDGMVQRRGAPPFDHQPGNAGQREDMLRRKMDVRDVVAREDLKAVRQRFESAMAASPGDWRLPAQWAEILMNAEGYEEAERNLHRELDLLPHRFDVRGGLALLLGYEGRAADGVRALAEIPGKGGHFPSELLLNTAKTLARDERLPEALVFAEASVKMVPENSDARDELTALLAMLGRWDDAEKTLLDGGDRPETRLKHAELLTARGDLVAAEKILRAVESQLPAPDAELYATLARICLKQKRMDEARAHLVRALELDPENASYRDLLNSLPSR